ncbi:histone-like nucleoid-structuring protein Lsr2 [Streptomyces collinus]|uniref:Lsr2 DNA-binding domain-containing protein n=1 Tax=Streptomyces collinus (strain DSM 40733 / Tue 365) TaxID=1214242 RepID=S5VSY2_STRC3|nr:hypothetical protein B446_35943 [Streptomyces collinus Tu 365]
MTTTDAEIRAWANDNGVPCNTRGMVPKAVRDQYEAAHPADDNPGLSSDEPAPEHGYAEAEAAPTRPQTADDVPPLPPPGRFGKLGRGKGGTVVRAKPERKRVSLESLAAGAWTLLGQAAQSRGLVPTGRALVMQAPVAGMILEDTLRGTVVDKVMQPLARGGESAKELGALLGVPVLVTMVTLKPETQPVALPMLKNLMREWAIIAGPRIKARERRERRAMEQLGVDETGLDEMVDGWIAALFMGPDEWAEDGAEDA